MSTPPSPTLSDYFENALPTWLGGSPVTPNELAERNAAANAEIAAVATSPGGMQSVTTLVPNDTNLVNGQTYTLVFSGGSSASNLQQDITGQAPSFITQVVVNPLSGGSGWSVQFVYEGDGSDVVSDVASSIIAAGLAVNGDQLGFVSASQQTTVGAIIGPTVVAQTAASTADQTTLANAANAAAKAQDTSSLTTTLIWIAVGLGVFLLAAPKLLSASGTKVSVGG
jgi:hypothetical protein